MAGRPRCVSGIDSPRSKRCKGESISLGQGVTAHSLFLRMTETSNATVILRNDYGGGDDDDRLMSPLSTGARYGREP